MAITRLKRKGQRNKSNSAKRLSAIKLLTASPVIKNVDVEALKQGFGKKSGSAAAKEEKTEATTAEKK